MYNTLKKALFSNQFLFLRSESSRQIMPSKKTTPYPHPEQLSLYEKLVETIAGLERKGDTIPYTSLNGHMFSYLDKEGRMALKLPKTELDSFIEKYKTGFHLAYGIVQKDYATVPDALLKNTKELSHYLQISFDYIKTVKPKPTKKAKG